VIIDTVPIGSNYKKITLRHPGFKDIDATSPGQCIRVNGRWLAVAGLRGDEADFLVHAKTAFDTERVSEIDTPPGTGFDNIDTHSAYSVY
jgi:hypothetical protein